MILTFQKILFYISFVETPGYVEMESPTINVTENVGVIEVPVVRLDGCDGELKVPYKILDVSAVAGLDYKPILGEVVFKDGEARQTITIPIIDDSVREPVETFQIQLLDINSQNDGVNYRKLVGDRPTTVVTIIDNDGKYIYCLRTVFAIFVCTL